MLTANLVYVLAFLAFMAMPNAISGLLFFIVTVIYLILPIRGKWKNKS